MNETPNETIARVKRQAERIYLDFTAQGDKRISTLKHTTTYQAEKVAQLAGLVMELADALVVLGGPEPGPEEVSVPSREQLRAMSQLNRDNAAVIYSERLTYYPGAKRWHERSTGQDVLFTPYGWIREADASEADRDIYVR